MISRRQYYIPMQIIQRRVSSDLFQDRIYREKDSEESFQFYFLRKRSEDKSNNLSSFGLFLFSFIGDLNYDNQRSVR